MVRFCCFEAPCFRADPHILGNYVMRLIVIGFLLSALAFGLCIQLYPLPLSFAESVVSEREVLLCLVALPLLVVIEGLWSMVQAGRARSVAVLLQEITERSTGYQERADALKVKLAAQEKAYSLEIDALRDAVRSAEAQRDAAQSKVANKGKDVLHFLSRLQEKGRFVDFVMEDVGAFTDQQIGAAARYVHGGCRSVVNEYLDLSPVQEGEEGKAITIAAIENPLMLRFIGRSAVQFPVTGTLVHRGWKATRVSLPEVSGGSTALEGSAVIMPAEIELR
jgi:hypothetical protein